MSNTNQVVNADELFPEPIDTVSLSQVEVGDIVTIPGTPAHRCRVRMVRSAAPGVIWLYLTEPTTGERLRGHIALPFDRSVLRHHATTASATDQVPDDG